jgi:hypothetical protein
MLGKEMIGMEDFYMGYTKKEIVDGILQLKERVGRLEEIIKKLALEQKEKE